MHSLTEPQSAFMHCSASLTHRCLVPCMMFLLPVTPSYTSTLNSLFCQRLNFFIDIRKTFLIPNDFLIFRGYGKKFEIAKWIKTDYKMPVLQLSLQTGSSVFAREKKYNIASLLYCTEKSLLFHQNISGISKIYLLCCFSYTWIKPQVQTHSFGIKRCVHQKSL